MLVLASLVSLSLAATTPVTFESPNVDWMFAIRDVAGFSVHPKEPKAIASVFGYENDKRTKQLFLMDLTGKSAPVLLTNPGDSEQSPVFAPDGSKYALLHVKDGIAQLVVRQLGSPKPVFAARFARGVEDYTWGADGQSVFFSFKQDPTCTERCYEQPESTSKVHASDELLIRRWDSWVDAERSVIAKLDLSNGEVTVLSDTKVNAPPFALHSPRDFDVSPDGQWLAWAEAPTSASEAAWSTDTHVILYALKSGEKTRVSVSPGYDRTPRFTKDSKSLVWLSMRTAGFEADRNDLFIYDLAKKERRALTPNWDFSVDEFEFSADGQHIFADVSDQGGHSLYRIALASGAAPQRWFWATGLALLGLSEQKVFVSPRTWTNGGVVASLPSQPAKAAKPADQISTTLYDFNSNVTLKNPPTVEAITVKGNPFPVQAWVVRPHGVQKGTKQPTFVMVHGGPQSPFTPSFSTRWNPMLWAARGYTVIAPNFRGTPGFGQAYTNAITKHWSAAYDDVMAVVDSEVAAGNVDDKRMCLGGASYGGYLTDWVATRTDRFKCLISHAGPYNLESQWGSTEELFFGEYEHGLPWKDRDVFDQQSPHRFTDRIKTPMLLLHGEKDYRVPYTQSLELFSALRRRGVKARLVVFSDENHWILGAANKRRWFAEMLGWVDQHLVTKSGS